MDIKCRLPRTSPIDRRDHIIAVAAPVFAEDGYGASSMSSIAARLGGSKATLYKYFPSKQHLFEAVMENRCARVLAPLRDLRSSGEDDLEALLTDFGARFLDRIYDTGSHAEIERHARHAAHIFVGGLRPDQASASSTSAACSLRQISKSGI